MKLRSLFFLSVFIFFCVLIFWSSSQGERTDAVELCDDDYLKAEMLNLKGAAERIKEKKVKISEKFKNQDFKGISEMYIVEGFFITHDGKMLKGRGQIKKYWKRLWDEENVREVNFEVESVVKFPKTIMIGEDEFDCVIFECSKVTFNKEKGEVKKNVLSNCSFWLHRTDCEDFCIGELLGGF